MAEKESSASLIEIFASAQGEGPEVGRSTVFVRFGGCDLRCRWCDSPGTWRRASSFRVERAAYSGEFDHHANPVEAKQIADWVDGLSAQSSTWVSLTGGEPLLQPDAVLAVAREFSGRGRRVYLETHGLHAEALARVANTIDLISMDWKFTSDVRMGPGIESPPGEDFHDAHERFLRIARDAGSVFVKAVLTPSTRNEELDAMLSRIESVSRDVPLVLQPVTPYGGVKGRPSAGQLLDWLALAEGRLSDVRLIPQTHPVYSAL